MKNNKNLQKGQTLILLLIFMIVAVTMITSAVAIIITNTQNASITEQTNISYYLAESGIENALLRLLRDPLYSGETLSIGNDTATITISGSDPYLVTSIGRDGNYTRILQATIGYTNNILTVISWKEIQ